MTFHLFDFSRQLRHVFGKKVSEIFRTLQLNEKLSQCYLKYHIKRNLRNILNGYTENSLTKPTRTWVADSLKVFISEGSINIKKRNHHLKYFAFDLLIFLSTLLDKRVQILTQNWCPCFLENNSDYLSFENFLNIQKLNIEISGILLK